MSSTSPNLGFTLADPTDTFDNDKYIKNNFQYIDTNVLPKSKTVQTPIALKMEVVTVNFTASGSSNTVQTTNIPYANTYTNAPAISPANVTVPESYVDTMDFPYVYNPTNTSFNVKLTAAGGNNFGAGTITMNFIVVGS